MCDKNNLYFFCKVNIPDVENGIRIDQYENILKKYVSSRVEDYYNWRDYQYSLKYAGTRDFIAFNLTFYLNKIF
jgi:hypothetical protein